MIKLILVILAILAAGYLFIPEGTINQIDSARDKVDNVIDSFKDTNISLKNTTIINQIIQNYQYTDYGPPFDKTYFPCTDDLQCYYHLDNQIIDIKCNQTTGNCYRLQ